MVGETPNTFYLLQQAYDDNGKPLDGKYIAKDGSITSSEEDANKYVTGKSSKAPYYWRSFYPSDIQELGSGYQRTWKFWCLCL